MQRAEQPPHAFPRGLIVSCQPVRGGRFDTVSFVAAAVAMAGDVGAVAVRLEGLRDVRACVEASPLPIVGLVKREVDGSPVFITPTYADVDDLVAAGAALVAFDATQRPRPVSVGDLIERIRTAGLGTVADVSSLSEGLAAATLGASYVATTLSGYEAATAADAGRSPPTEGPDLELVAALAERGVRVIAEGRIATPDHARAALERGAHAVVVGTAVTRPELVAQRFMQAIGTRDA